MKLKESGGGWACLRPSPLPPPPSAPRKTPHLCHSQDAGAAPRSAALRRFVKRVLRVQRLPARPGFTRPPCSGRPPPSGWEAWPAGGATRMRFLPGPGGSMSTSTSAGDLAVPSPLCHPRPRAGGPRQDLAGDAAAPKTAGDRGWGVPARLRGSAHWLWRQAAWGVRRCSATCGPGALGQRPGLQEPVSSSVEGI